MAETPNVSLVLITTRKLHSRSYAKRAVRCFGGEGIGEKMLQEAKFKSKTIHELDGKMIKEEEEMRTMDKLDEIAKKRTCRKR